METLKLGFIADRSAPFYSGGYERHLLSLATELSKDHEVHVFTSMPIPSYRLGRVDFVRIAPPIDYVGREGRHATVPSLYFGFSAFSFTPDLASFDFVNVEGIPFAHVPMLRTRLDFRSLRWAITIWEVWSDPNHFSGPLRRLQLAAFRSALSLSVRGNHKVIAGSRHTLDELMREFHVVTGRMGLVTPHVDIMKFASNGSVKRDIDILYVGRLAAYKRPQDLVMLAARTIHELPFLKVVIAGDGPESRRLRGVVNELGLQERVTVLGAVDEYRKVDLMRRTKLFVLPSEREGFSIATLEAMACGASPIVAVPSDVGAFGAAEVIDDGKVGLTYPCGSIENLVRSVTFALSSPDWLQRTSEAATRRARYFDVSLLATRYLKAVGLK